MEVTEHPTELFNRRLVLVRVEHEGRQQTSSGDVERIEDNYKSSFLAIDAKRQYRPRRKTPPPRIQGPQTATVVGPKGEEIHPDKYGRIKVQFHWDRDGKKYDKSSAWVRTGQSWSGPGMGGVFLPRVGQEVMVRFLEGNPDRPLATGAIYNGENPPPITFPPRTVLRWV